MSQRVEYLTAIELISDADLDGLTDTSMRQSDEVDSTVDGADDYMLLGAFDSAAAPTGDGIVYVWWNNNPFAPSDRTDGASGTSGSYAGTIQDSVEALRRVGLGTTMARFRPVSIRDLFGFVPAAWGVIFLNSTGQTLQSGSGKYVVAQPIRYIES